MPQYESSLIRFSHNLTSQSGDGYSQHCHPVFEIYYFISGDVDYLVEGVYYHPVPHSLLLLAPGTFHGFRCNSLAPYERFTLHFDRRIIPAPAQETLLSPFFSGGIYVSAAQPYFSYLLGMDACARLPAPARDECARAHALALLGQLRAGLSAGAPTGESGPAATLTQQVIAYLNVHLGQPHTLESLSRRFFVSRSHLSRAFLQETGASVAEYIRQKRLTYALSLIHICPPADANRVRPVSARPVSVHVPANFHS